MWSPSKSLITAFVIACLGSGVALAYDFESPGQLRADLEERFVLLPLSDGLVLQPIDMGDGPRAIEVSDGDVALDGTVVGTDELRLRLGDEAAEMILAAADLDTEALRGLPSVSLVEEMSLEAIEEAADEAAAALGETEESADEELDGARARAEKKLERAKRDIERARRAKKHQYRRTGDTEFAFGSSVTVDEDEVTEDVVVLGGYLKVKGRVEGNATVMAGSAAIEGEVTGDVTAIGGPVRLGDGAVVHGDVTSVGDRVYQDDGAEVHGDIEQVPFTADFDFADWGEWRRWDRSYDWDVSPWHWWSGLGWSLVKLVFLIGIAWLALLLGQGPIDRMERRIGAEPWKTGLVGLLTQVLFFPVLVMLVVFLTVSVIGIPLLLILPFALLALVIMALLGFVAVAGRVGSWAEERFGWSLSSPYWVVLVGLGLIFALSVIGDLLDFGIAPMRFIAGMFMFFGAIITWAAWTIGFGAVVLTKFGTAESWSRAEEVAAPLPSAPTHSASDDIDDDLPELPPPADDVAGDADADADADVEPSDPHEEDE